MARRKLDINALPSNNTEPIDKDLEIVTTGRVKTRGGKGITSEVRNISNALFAESVLPSLKTTFLDFASQALERLLFGGSSSVGPRGKHRPYHKAYNTRKKRHTRQPRPVIRQTEEVFEDIFFEHREDAEAVLGRMMELVAEYGRATIGDLYQMSGLSPNYVHERYEWNDLSGCRVQYTTEGYLINFPEPYAA